MAKPKKIEISETPSTLAIPETKIQPLIQEFGNGDMNILRDKINEIIRLQ